MPNQSPKKPHKEINPNDIPKEIGLERSHIEAIVKAFYTAKYKIPPGSRKFSFSWKQFTPELVVKIER